MWQSTQKQVAKFCTSKRAEKEKTHPEKSEKGKTGCVLGAGEGSSGWRRMKLGEKGRYRAGKGRTVPPLHDGNGGTDLNLLRKPSCGARLCLRRRGRLANRRPLRHPRLAASATGGASAAMPDTLRVPRFRPLPLRKRPALRMQCWSFWQGQKDLNPRHAVLEWMWDNAYVSRKGAILPGSFRKSGRGWCWFGAARNFSGQNTVSNRLFKRIFHYGAGFI